MNTISAAALEVAIMGIFVIIAQPQLRDALFELLQVDPAHTATQTVVSRPAATVSPGFTATSGSDTSPTAPLDRTVQAVLNSPVGQAMEKSLAQWTGGQRPDMNVPSLSSYPALLSSNLPSTSPASFQTPSALGSQRDQSAFNHMAGYSPFDQYESIRVTVPTNNQGLQQASANGQYATGQYATQYVPPQNYANQNVYGLQNHVPTQLTANQWNIASASQLPQPNGNQQNANQWIPSPVTETSFRQPYPPPYGTQSMWK